MVDSTTGQQPKVIVTMPAYQAERTLVDVVQLIPVDWVDDIIVVDDASTDRTVERAQQLGLTTFVHPSNRGYGANQKTGYTEAIRRGADIVVMLHADHQYDPRLLPDLIQPILNGDADLVLGSRCLKDETIKGGMPRWKWLGHRFLTTIQNLWLGQHFSEYHTGYRAYLRRFLEAVPFLRNSSNFVFDSQIAIQARAFEMRVEEVPIPT